MFKKLLVPVDGSPHSMDALNVACALALPEATIHLLNVPELPPATEAPGRWVEAAVPEAYRDDAQKTARRLLEETVSSVSEPGISFETDVRWGSTAHVIAAQAKRLDVDAIVMGSRGLSDLAGLVMGSVSHRVMHTAPCRVVLVR